MKIKANGNAIQNEVTNPHRSFGRTYGKRRLAFISQERSDYLPITPLITP